MKKIAIVARAPSSRYMAPFDDPDCAIWTLSPASDGEGGYTDLPRWDRWYEIHRLLDVEAECPGYSDWLGDQASAGKDIVLQDDYPLDAAKALGGAYFTSTVSYMLAAAILESPDWIGLYGCDMAHETEYHYQRPCVEYWLGIARGRGIEVEVPAESDALKTSRLYGFDSASPLRSKLLIRRREMQQKLQDREDYIKGALGEAAAMLGAKCELEQLGNNINGHGPVEIREMLTQRCRECEDRVASLSAAKQAAEIEGGILRGHLAQIDWDLQWE